MATSSDTVRDELEWIGRDYRAIVRSARPEELDLPTTGTRWTNRQLLFHMLLGQIVTRAVIVVMGAFSRLPPGASRGWAAGMSAATPAYNWLNWLGSVIGGRLFTLTRMGRRMEIVTRNVLRFYDHAVPADLGRGMTVPPSWDPYFSSWMDRSALLAWAPMHYRHHRRQLTLTTLPAA